MSDARPPGVLPLIETVERLWPDASEVALVGPRGAAAPAGRSAWELLAVPNAARPRVLLPAAGRPAATAMQRFSAAVSVREVMERRAMGAALAVGGSRLLRDRLHVVDPGDDHIVALLEEVLGQPVSVSIGIGTVRANRKPVLGVFDRSGRPLAFAKVGDSPVAVGHVLGEARALAQVADHAWSLVQPPRMLAQRSWRGMEVLVMTALRPRAWRGRGVWPIPVDAADEVSTAFDGGRQALGDTPMWHRCESAAATLVDPAAREQLTVSMSRVLAAAGDRQLRVGGFHGDFTPWNLARRGGRVLLWDWERFETGVPRGLDRLHYAVNTVLRAEGLGSAQLLEGLRRGAGQRDPDGPGDDVLAAAYLVSLACRYLVAAQDDGGDAIRPRADLVLATLAQVSERLTVDAAGRGTR